MSNLLTPESVAARPDASQFSGQNGYPSSGAFSKSFAPRKISSPKIKGTISRPICWKPANSPGMKRPLLP